MPIPNTRIAILAVAITTCGCLSVEPVDFQPKPRDSAVPDTTAEETAADGDADGDAPLTCRQCIEAPDDPGPGCGAEVAACQASTKCKQIYQCLYDAGCWAKGAEKDFIACGLPCALEAGIIAIDDPEVQLAIAIARCELKKCGASCHPSETGP